ncbi:MAG: hypothetical protein QW228_05940 [Candidatus Aenigmatarchaeota archaeon]
MKEKIKKFAKNVKAFMTKPLTPTEKKLLKNIENMDIFGGLDIFEDKNPASIKDEVKIAKKLESCKHEFIVKDFKNQLLKCKNCGLEINALNLGRNLGKRVLKKKYTYDLDIKDILKI